MELGRTAVYRLYSERDALLYVGITHQPDVRFAQHAKDKWWWGEVHRREMDWADTRAEASIAEQDLVEHLTPRYNAAMPPWRIPDPPLDHLPPAEAAAARQDFEALRRDVNAARAALFAGIRKYLAEGRGPSEIGRSVDWTREYIAKIRDGKVKD